MPINISVPDLAELKPRITVFGVGGGGCNAVNNMINSNLTGVEFVVANTDAQALAKSPCERRIQMGVSITEGLGAGSQPEIGAAAAEEARSEIEEHLVGSHMVFITAGMGGGTGTGAAPVIASLARENGILTVGVVTKPFNFEGRRRMATAERGIETLAQHVDTLIVIPNQNLFRVANEATSFTAAFQMADQVLYSGVASITELMTKEGLINLDFADVRAVMSDMGKAMMGTGEASGESRAEEAAQAAISNPLLDIDSMAGARGVLISIAGGPDLTLYEVDQAASRIREEVDPEANIIVGATIEEELEGTMRVSVVATGLQQEAHAQNAPVQESRPATAAGGGLYPGMSTGMGGGGCLVGAGGTAVQGGRSPAAGAAPATAPMQTQQVQEQERPQPVQPAMQEESGAEQPPLQEPPTLRGAQTQDDDALQGEQMLPLEETENGAIEKKTDEVAPQGMSADTHQPAPVAPHVPTGQRVPGVQELPENIRRLAEEKQKQINALGNNAAAAPQPAAAGVRVHPAPVSEGEGGKNAGGSAAEKSGMRAMLFGKVKKMFVGRGQPAPQPPVQKEPQARAVAGAAGAAAGGADAAHSPLADDDGLNIPAFLRRN